MAAGPLRPSGSSPLFGRGEILEESGSLLDEAGRGQGSILVLEGPAGVGKTTFLEAVIARAQQQGFRCLSARSRPSDLPEPYALVRELVNTVSADAAEGSATRAEASNLMPMFLAPVGGAPVLPASGGDRTGVPEEEADRLLTRLSDPGDRLRGEQRGLHDRLVDFFRELSETRPLLIVVDDLQWSDRSSLDFLATLSHSLARERIALVASIVPSGEVAVESTAAVEAILRSPSTRILALRPLTESELAEYARWLLGGREPDPDAIRRWFTQTEGNPLFVENLVRSQAGAAPGPLEPSDLHAMLRRRFDGLSEADRRNLVYAAILGREFRFEALAGASPAPEEELTESLDRLVQAGLLRERPNETFEFASDRIRADVYGELTETRRGILHRKVLRALESGAPGGPAAVFDLARHAYLGRDDERSAEYNRRAAEVATEALALEEAAAYLERALESLRRLPKRELASELRTLVELGRILDELGDLHRAEAMLEDAVARARAMETGDKDLAVALLGLARVRADRVELATAKSLATEAFEILDRIGDPRGVMAAHRVLGTTMYRLGDLDGAEAHQRAELQIAEREGTPSERGHALIDLANTFISRGADRLPEALRLYDQAAAIFTERNDDAARARVLMNRGLLYHNVGKVPESLTDLREAAAAADRSRSKVWIGYTQLNLAQLLAETHRPAEGRRALDRATALLEPLGDRLITQSARMIRGMLDEEEGRLSEADGDYAEAIRLAQELQLGPDAAESLFRRARLAERRELRTEAQRYLHDAMNLGLLRTKLDLVPAAEELALRLGLAIPAELR